MREYLTADDICNQVSMTRSVFDGVVMLVEGVTDQRLFEKFIDKGSVMIIPGHSRDNVRGAVRTLSDRRKDGKAIGVIDPDLDRLDGKKVSPPLFYTDFRDMEMMVIRSNALEDVLDEYCDQELLDAFSERVGPVRDALVSASYPIGLLMWVSQRERLNLSFKDLDFTRFVNPRTLSLDAHAMVNDVINNSFNCRIGRRDLLAKLDHEASELDDIWMAARGHDTVAILLIGLKKNFGSFNSRSLTTGELGGALRLAFSDNDFEGTDLYTATEKWAVSRGVSLWNLVTQHRSSRS